MDSVPRPHLLHVFSTFGTGGPQVRTCDILNHFGGAYRHTILAMDGNLTARKRLLGNLDVTFPEIAFRKKDTLRNVFRFRKLLKELAPDALLTYNWGTIEWAVANCLLPVCGHIHMEEGFGPDEALKQNPTRVRFRRIFLSRATRVLVPSMNLYRLATVTWKLPKSKVTYVPNGIDVDRFAELAQSAQSAKTEANVVGTVATLRKEKNIPRLIEAFRKLPENLNAVLRIAGGGQDEDMLTDFIRREGLSDRVEMLGYQADPAPVLAGFSVFAITSDTEQMPISVLEAMAAGLPVVGTDVGDIKRMIAEENWPYITPKEDTDALTANFAKLLIDKGLARSIGHANQEKCKREFGKAEMMKRFAALYFEAIESTRAA